MLDEDILTEMSKEIEEVSEGEDHQIDESLIFTKDVTVDLGQLEDLLYCTKELFKTGKYFNFLDHIENTIDIGEVTLKRYQAKGLSFAILSSERLVESLEELNLDTKEANELLSQSKKYFMEGNYEEGGKTVRMIRDLTFILRNQQRYKACEMIKNLESRINEAKRIGANTGYAERKFNEAKLLFDRGLLIFCQKTLDKANETLKDTKECRISVIKESIAFVDCLIADAREIGVDVSDSEELLNTAKSLFLNEEFQMCIHTTIQAEEMTTDMISRQVKKAQTLADSLNERFKAVATAIPYTQLSSEKWQGFSKASEVKNTCTTCEGELEYIHRYRRWFCSNCVKYL